MKADSQEAFSDLRHDEAAITSPGALLRDRRLALRLNEWDIAREMRLQTQYILDLEADNFDAFSSLAFVRGYLRGYAKLVGIAEMDVMQLFNQLSLQDKVVAGVPKYITHDRSHGDRYWRWMGLGVIAFIVISLVLWWQNYNSNIKTLNTSVDTTLTQVSGLQKTLQAENMAAQAQIAPVTTTSDQINGVLGASSDLLSTPVANTTGPATANTSLLTQNPPAVPTAATTSLPTQNPPAAPTAATTSLPTQNPPVAPATVPASNANSYASTMPENDATTSPLPVAAAPNSTNTNTARPAFKPKRKHAESGASQSSDQPVVDGQAPRLDDN